MPGKKQIKQNKIKTPKPKSHPSAERQISQEFPLSIRSLKWSDRNGVDCAVMSWCEKAVIGQRLQNLSSAYVFKNIYVFHSDYG